EFAVGEDSNASDGSAIFCIDSPPAHDSRLTALKRRLAGGALCGFQGAEGRCFRMLMRTAAGAKREQDYSALHRRVVALVWPESKVDATSYIDWRGPAKWTR